MLRQLRLHRLSHGTGVAYMALFVALGGTAYAVKTVGSADIIDGEVKSVDMGHNEIPLDVTINESPFASFNPLVIEDGVTGLD